LKLVIGVDISRREDSSEGSEVWVWRSRRREKAEMRTRFRRLEEFRRIEVIGWSEMGY
jgi:hypothetical protein